MKQGEEHITSFAIMYSKSMLYYRVQYSIRQDITEYYNKIIQCV